MPRTITVAVIGSGLAGLTAAYLLSNSSNQTIEFDVHLFEKTCTIGMDASSISIPNPGNKEEWRVDVPMRSFQGGYYKKLISLYRYLGVGFRETDFSYSFSNLYASMHGRSIATTKIYNGNSGRAGVSMPSATRNLYLKEDRILLRGLSKACAYLLFAFWALQILFCYIRLLILSIPFIRPTRIETMTFRTWAKQTVPKGFLARLLMLDTAWADFTDHVMLPLFSAVCTAPHGDIFEHPMEEFLDYIWLTLGTHHYVATNGVQDVISRLTAHIPHIHLSSTISKISMDSDNPSLATIECYSSSGITKHSGFQHIILATQANRAIPLLQSLASSFPLKKTDRCRDIERQIDCLQHFSYAPTIVINHTDDTLIPDSPRDRRDLNLISVHSATQILTEPKSTGDADSNYLPSTYTMATHILQRPKRFPSHLPTVFQTTNPIVPVRQSRILSMTKLDRAVLTLDAKRALDGLHTEVRQPWQCAGQGKSRLGKLQGGGRMNDTDTVGVWICGSFAHSGIPLLEGCVMSARNVVEHGIWKCEGYHGHIYW